MKFNKSKRFLSFFLAIVLCFSVIAVTALASDDTFSVSVPASVDLRLDKNGYVNTPYLEIKNNSISKSAVVTDIQVVLTNGWQFVDWDSDFDSMPADSKYIALSFRGDTVDMNGVVDLTGNNWIVGRDSTLALNLDVRMPRQTVATYRNPIAYINWRADWAVVGYQIRFTNGANDRVNDMTPLRTNESGVVPALPGTTPSRGYVFAGWVDQNGNPVADGGVISSDVTLTPVFEKQDNTRTISFVPGDNGTIDDMTPVMTDADGRVVDLPHVTPDAGYAFSYWVDDKGYVVEIGDVLDSDVTLRPVFTEVQSVFTIDFEDGLNGRVTDKRQLKTNKAGVVPSLPVVTPDDGYELDHWVDQNGVTVAMGDVLTYDVILTPVCEEIEYVDFVIDKTNSSLVGYDNTVTDWVIPATFEYQGVHYKVVGIDNMVFDDNATLVSVTMPDTLERIGFGAFRDCSSLTTVNFGAGVVEVGNGAFSNCQKLVNVYFPEGYSALGGQMFYGSKSLTSITLPSTVKVIPWKAFCMCYGLTTVKAYGVETIEDGAFEYDRALTSIYLPSSLSAVGTEAFDDVSSSLFVYYGGSQSMWRSISVGSSNSLFTNARVTYNYSY